MFDPVSNKCGVSPEVRVRSTLPAKLLFREAVVAGSEVPMSHESTSLPKAHFHILWSTTTELDWQSFETIEEAEQRAEELVGQGETYTIEQRGLSSCERCGTRIAWGTMIESVPPSKSIVRCNMARVRTYARTIQNA